MNNNFIDNMNASQGKLRYIVCSKCLNKGYILVGKECEDYFTVETIECGCIQQRKNLSKFERQGIIEMLVKSTFNSFDDKEEWQHSIKEKSKNSVNGDDWAIICGQIGSGKTHLALSIINELMESNKSIQVSNWQEMISVLKANLNTEYYFSVLKEYTDPDILLIDDFFKVGLSNNPTNSDIRLSQIIVEHRYSRNKKTLFTSELMIDEILEISESIGSRIYDKAIDNIIQISRDIERNFRFSKKKNIE